MFDTVPSTPSFALYSFDKTTEYPFFASLLDKSLRPKVPNATPPANTPGVLSAAFATFNALIDIFNSSLIYFIFILLYHFTNYM